jgi:hypothetical protein
LNTLRGRSASRFNTVPQAITQREVIRSVSQSHGSLSIRRKLPETPLANADINRLSDSDRLSSSDSDVESTSLRRARQWTMDQARRKQTTAISNVGERQPTIALTRKIRKATENGHSSAESSTAFERQESRNAVEEEVNELRQEVRCLKQQLTYQGENKHEYDYAMNDEIRLRNLGKPRAMSNTFKTPLAQRDARTNRVTYPVRNPSIAPRREKKVGDYNGEPEVEAYLRQFQIIATYNNWSRGECGMMLAASLRGPARQVLPTDPSEPLPSYAELCARLRERFGPVTQPAFHMAALNAVTRRDKEQVQELVARIRPLGTRAYPRDETRRERKHIGGTFYLRTH